MAPIGSNTRCALGGCCKALGKSRKEAAGAVTAYSAYSAYCAVHSAEPCEVRVHVVRNVKCEREKMSFQVVSTI